MLLLLLCPINSLYDLVTMTLKITVENYMDSMFNGNNQSLFVFNSHFGMCLTWTSLRGLSLLIHDLKLSKLYVLWKELFKSWHYYQTRENYRENRLMWPAVSAIVFPDNDKYAPLFTSISHFKSSDLGLNMSKK